MLFYCIRSRHDKKKSEVLPLVDIGHFLNKPTLTDVNKASPTYLLTKELMETLGALDMGEALKYLPAVQIKDYGGVGGIKTISYRSLGASHTGVVLDNNSQINTQTGVLNLSTFETFGMKSIEFTSGQPSTALALASAYLPANVISVNTELMNIDTAYGVKLYQNTTTINSFESGVLFQTPITKKSFLAAQGFVKYGNGNYKYTYNLTGSDEEFVRNNSEILNTKVRIGGGYQSNNIKCTASLFYNKNDQELPGAVILYNSSNDQQLNNEDTRADVDFIAHQGKYLIRSNAYFQSNSTLYNDPSFLNSQGFLRANYKQKNQGVGVIVSRFFKKKNQKVFLGTDVVYSRLRSSEFQTQPTRLKLNSVIGCNKSIGPVNIEANIAHQLIDDKSHSGDSILNAQLNKFSPFFALSYTLTKKIPLKIRAFYKQAYRLPSFNDLYYNYIGNLNLKPEEAMLTNLGLTYSKWFRRGGGKNNEMNKLEFTIDAYYNEVTNKIVAIPTKNLFNWSMQNIGKTEALGVDFSATFVVQKKDWKYTFMTNHSLNKTVDITDPNGPTFGHQIPYTPKYTNSSSALICYKGYGLNLNAIYAGQRYTLNENINSNLLKAYFDLNLGVQKEFEFENTVRLAVDLKAMNLLNKNYEIIRSFPMAGRYYQLTLNFSYK